MSSRKDKLVSAFTPKQRDWLFQNPPEHPALSDDEAVVNAARALLSAGIYKNVEEKKDLTKKASAPVPSFDLETLAGVVGYSDKEENGKKVTAGEIFRNAYFGGEKDKDKRNLWRTNIKAKYGDDAWEHAKKVLREAELAKMDSDIVKARKEAVESVPGSSIVELFRPRMYRNALEGKGTEDEIEASDVADIGQSLLYALPVGKAVSAIRGLPKAASVIGGLAAQGVAPLGVSIMDDALDQKDFDWRDVGIGTLTNIGVNKALAPQFSRAYQFGMGKIRGRMPGLADFLEGGKTSKEKAWDLIDEAKDKLKKHYAEREPQYLNKLAHGQPTDRLSPEDVRKYTEIVAVDDLLRNTGLEAKEAFTGKVKEKMGYGIGGSKQPQARMIGKDKAWVAEQNAPRDRNATEILDEVIWGGDDKLMKKDAVNAIAKNPVLASLLYKTPAREAADALALEGMKNWAVNEYGKDAEASNPANLVGVDVKEIRKKQKEEQAKNKRQKAADVLNVSNLTGEDAYYINLIKKNPGAVQFGLNSGNNAEDTKFKNWLLVRGNDILRSQGSDLLRPTPKVE